MAGFGSKYSMVGEREKGDVFYVSLFLSCLYINVCITWLQAFGTTLVVASVTEGKAGREDEEGERRDGAGEGEEGREGGRRRRRREEGLDSWFPTLVVLVLEGLAGCTRCGPRRTIPS